MTEQQEAILKAQFVKKNPYAATGVKAAAAAHVKFYADTTTPQERFRIRTLWANKIEQLRMRYRENRNSDDFITDVHELCSYMNEQFPNSFAEGSFSFARGQKSLAVSLKYWWCNGSHPMPPLCPIDRGVLRRLGHPFNTWNWTAMSEAQYIQSYQRICEIANDSHLSVAQLELKWFSN